MKKLFATAVMLSIWSFGLAAQSEQQKQSTAKANAGADANSQSELNAGSATLNAGSKISAEMTSSLDLKKAKPGDSFKMKTTKAVKNQGKEIISRGSTITGHVEQVTRADKTTKATLVFDRLQDKKTGLTSALPAVVTAVISASNNVNAMASEEAMPAVRPSGPARQQSSQPSGGLLGGVTQTVGGVTQTAGGAVNSTTNATLGTSSGVTGAVGGLGRGAIQIVNDTTATATSGSTLTLADRNAKIESGTQFLLETTSALTLTKKPKQQ